jgi:hypothetical protein
LFTLFPHDIRQPHVCVLDHRTDLVTYSGQRSFGREDFTSDTANVRDLEQFFDLMVEFLSFLVPLRSGFFQLQFHLPADHTDAGIKFLVELLFQVARYIMAQTGFGLGGGGGQPAVDRTNELLRAL